MSAPRAYLDHNATAPVRPEVVDGCVAAMALANASSVHREGRQARAAIETARGRVARLVGAGSASVTFTSGGTEANNLVLRPGFLLTPSGRPVERLIVGATEHPSVLSGHSFPGDCVLLVEVGPDGVIDADALQAALAASDRAALVSVQAANSETGVLQPWSDIAAFCAAADAAFHGDAVQVAGRLPIAMTQDGFDALTISGHKLGGLPGAGALLVAPGRRGPADAMLRGGSQERGERAGTENVPAIVGSGIAADCALRGLQGEVGRLAVLRDEAIAVVRSIAPGATIFGEAARRLPNTLAFAVPGLRAETALMALDLAGIAVSSGSACTSGKVGRSHVLAAMGVPATLAAGAIRVSLGWNSTGADLARFREAFETLLQRLYDRERRAA